MGEAIDFMEGMECVACCPECGGEYWTILADKPGKRKDVVLVAMRCANEECGLEAPLNDEAA